MATKIGQTGKLMNCDQWADWEEKGSSGSSRICHGGLFQGTNYAACPSRHDCMHATKREAAKKRMASPTYSSYAGGGSQLLASTSRSPLSGTFDRTTIPTKRTLPTFGQQHHQQNHQGIQQRRHEYAHEHHHPMPIVPPETYPTAMRTPYAASASPYLGGMTPTFLPENDEGTFIRLGKNMTQGAIGAVFYQGWDYARCVDFFRKIR